MASLRVAGSLAIRDAAQAQWAWIARISARLGAELTVWADARAFPPLAVWCGLNCVGILAVVRRFSDVPPSKMIAPDIVFGATLAAILAIGARLALARVENHRPARWLRGLASVACAAPIVLLFTAPHAPLGGLHQAYLGGLAVVSALVGARWSCELTDQVLSAGLSNAAHKRQIARSLRQISTVEQVEQTAQKVHSVSSATLRIERRVLSKGIEQIEGVAVAEFPPGQALATVHVGFCPPLLPSPELTFQSLGDSGTSVRIKAAGVFPWGCRFELKRTADTTTAQRTEIAFRAEPREQGRSAA